jgi:hypothetical protein
MVGGRQVMVIAWIKVGICWVAVIMGHRWLLAVIELVKIRWMMESSWVVVSPSAMVNASIILLFRRHSIHFFISGRLMNLRCTHV